MQAAKNFRSNTYLGLFFISLSTLMYEMLLTRIFSVTMWYHFAFMAISIALFGMTVGALIVYLMPKVFTQDRVYSQLSIASLAFSISLVFSFLTHLSIPFLPEKSLVGVYSIGLTYFVISIPFIFSGISICLVLTRFPDKIGKLYASDLIGAALGCILLVLTLNLTDAPTAVFAVAFLGALGSLFFSWGRKTMKIWKVALVSALSVFIFVAVNTSLSHKGKSLIRLVWVKGVQETPPLLERWNSFSRIRVFGYPDLETRPMGYGLSRTYHSDVKIRQVGMDIDAAAYTPITAFNGDLKPFEFLKYDLPNLAHTIRPESDILIIGTGGGRDVLSALVFNQKKITGVEINEDIINIVNRDYGEFSGHLDQHPKVTFINDEARSFIAREKNKYDIIQASMIDTWAATAAGAFVLSENSLYTTEAWRIFYEHLTARGVLTFTRWYYENNPGEMYRITALASKMLTDVGTGNPRDHIIIAKNTNRKPKTQDMMPEGIGTILVSKKPFSESDVASLTDLVERLQFTMILSPDYAADSTFIKITSGKVSQKFLDEFPINISAPTDNSPFFFHMLRLKDIFKPELRVHGNMSFNMKAIFILGILLMVVVFLTGVFIILPLVLTMKKVSLKNTFPLFLFFASIGLGFMLVEISQMQRLIVFLGHPIYGLAVVLFSLLLSSGIGSSFTQKIDISNLGKSGVQRFIILLSLLAVFGIFTPQIVHACQAFSTPLRILVAVAILFPIGLFMGMAFPMGMKMASKRRDELTPWFWGINGSMSVCASVLSIVIALSMGISASFWTGFVFYCLALLSFTWAGKLKIT